MLKRVNWKVIFKGFAWLTCLAGVVVLMSFIDAKKQEVKCTKIEILIPGADNFIEREEIDAILKQSQGQLVGRSLERINIHDIEEALKANPYIAFAKVFVDMDGVLQVAIRQRQPVLRVLNAGGQDYYIDSNGLKMPMSPNFTANVLVASGNILEGFSGKVDTLLTPMGTDLYKAALFMKKDTLWDAQIEQIYVNDKSDLELVPRVGNQRIILGNADSLETKMSNLLAFYKQAMPTVGWNVYKTINLKYTNQIVCEKYDSLAVKKAKPVITDSAVIATRQATDSVIRNTIQDEIKKAVAADQATKPATPKPVAPKPATTTSANKPTATAKEKPAAEKPKTNATPAKTPAKDKPKQEAATKVKTDTKKNK